MGQEDSRGYGENAATVGPASTTTAAAFSALCPPDQYNKTRTKKIKKEKISTCDPIKKRKRGRGKIKKLEEAVFLITNLNHQRSIASYGESIVSEEVSVEAIARILPTTLVQEIILGFSFVVGTNRVCFIATVKLRIFCSRGYGAVNPILGRCLFFFWCVCVVDEHRGEKKIWVFVFSTRLRFRIFFWEIG